MSWGVGEKCWGRILGKVQWASLVVLFDPSPGDVDPQQVWVVSKWFLGFVRDAVVIVFLHEAFHANKVSVEQDGLCDRGIWVLW